MGKKRTDYGDELPDQVNIEFRFSYNKNKDKKLYDIFSNPGKRYRYSVFEDYCGIVPFRQQSYSRVCSRGNYNSKECDTAAPDQFKFLYMDVGRWGGKDHREFGIICGCFAVLCKFYCNKKLKTNPEIVGSDDAAKKIDDVLKLICGNKHGIEIIKSEKIQTNTTNYSDEPLSIFLGDIHLPLYTKVPSPMKITRMDGTQTLGSMENQLPHYWIIGNLEDVDQQKEWFKKYIEGDIFNGDGGDLLAFLKGVEKANETIKIHFFQLGDMYELWLGLERYYQTEDELKSTQKDKNYRIVKLKEFSDRGDYWSKDFILNSVEQIHTSSRIVNFANGPGRIFDYNALVANYLNELHVNKKTFLYGNHDCYLGAFTPKKNDFKEHSQRWNFMDTEPPNINNARKRNYRIGGIYCEHGHWVDKDNCDGNSGSGHVVTNAVFKEKWARSLDKLVGFDRYRLIAGAAIEFYKNPNFSFFVMGHTHYPYLSIINISKISLISNATVDELDVREGNPLSGW